jgi:hypothetical protein
LIVSFVRRRAGTEVGVASPKSFQMLHVFSTWPNSRDKILFKKSRVKEKWNKRKFALCLKSISNIKKCDIGQLNDDKGTFTVNVRTN